MKWLSLANLKSLDVVDRDPRQAKPIPAFVDDDGALNKNAFRKWCTNENTDHVFYNHSEGLIPTARVTHDNPPFYLHGFTADYDAEQTQEEVIALMKKNATHMPRWISSTFSGGVRLTWLFEEPVLVDNPSLRERFMAELGKELAVEKLALSFDDSSYAIEKQYFEAGTNWTDLNGPPLTSKLLSTIFFRAANQTKIVGDYTIPLEDVAIEVEKRWPGRAEIFAGSRTSLFWVEPYEERIGAQVGDFGMLCYSTRAGKSFVSWADLFGVEFMKSYQAERIGSAAEGMYYDGQNYWRYDSGWRKRNTEETQRWLRLNGISPKPVKGSKFGTEVDMVLNHAQTHNEVKSAVPIVHNKNRIVVINGEKYLNISEKKMIEPAESGDPTKWPFIHLLINNVWAEPQQLQRDFYLAWLRYAYVHCLEGDPVQGQAVIIGGPTSVGKSFWSLRVLGPIFGGSADPTNYLLGDTHFNKDLAESYIWACDDSRVASSWENKVKFANNLKKHVANPQVRCEGKFRDAVTLPCYGRIHGTCNLTKSALEFIPHMDPTIYDKLCLFLWQDWKAPFLPAKGSESVALKELPFFLKWLLNWTVPAHVVAKDPRFAVGYYHHPTLLNSAIEAGSGARLREMLEEFHEGSADVAEAKKAKRKIWATPTKIRKYLSGEPSFRDSLREFGKNRMDMALEELNLPSRRASATSVQYLIYDPAQTLSELCQPNKAGVE